MLPCMDNRRLIPITKELFLHFTTIHDHAVNFDDLKGEKWNNPNFETKSIGSAILTFDDFAVPVWIGKNNVSLMVSKEET